MEDTRRTDKEKDSSAVHLEAVKSVYKIFYKNNRSQLPIAQGDVLKY